MQEDLNMLSNKIKQLSESLIKKENEYNHLLNAQKDLARKLLKSIKMLIDEKCARQLSDGRANEMKDQVARLHLEKVTRTENTWEVLIAFY